MISKQSHVHSVDTMVFTTFHDGFYYFSTCLFEYHELEHYILMPSSMGLQSAPPSSHLPQPADSLPPTRRTYGALDQWYLSI